MQPTKFWADVCRHMDLEGYIDDPRFATAESFAEHTPEAVEILTEAMKKRTLPEWSERFTTLAGPWAPVQDTLQAAQDAQIRANEYLVQAGELELVANPVQFDVTAPNTGPRRGSPNRPTTSWANSAWTGIASSNSRPPAPSPRPPSQCPSTSPSEPVCRGRLPSCPRQERQSRATVRRAAERPAPIVNHPSKF